MIRLGVFDGVTWEGRAVPGERNQALFRALVEAGARGLSTEALADELWPDEQPVDPHKALQVVVSRARSATSAGVIERTATGYRLGLEQSEVDVWAARPEGLRLAAEGKYADALVHLARAGSDDEVMLARLRAIAETRGVPAALEAYDAYREELADRLGVDPAPALQQLHAELLQRDRPVRTGVGFDPDPLIGRTDDIAALQTLVRTARVVSIVGAGGLGKTRLAHLLGRTAEQPVVHFVALASVTSGDGVAVEVADAIGVQGSLTAHLVGPARTADVIDRTVEALGSVPSLLILDNCEQVVDAVADLVSVLIRRTPHLTVLTTTRAPLGLSAERVYLLPELSLQDGLALFRERAAAARPGVVLEDDRIAALVQRLDGLPLAVELAAAKVRAMSVDEIERRLDNRFSLLRGGSRDAPERHQTLLAVIDWSWNLLDERERRALRRLSVFRAGFALSGAEAVVGPEALERIEELAAQSLVVVTESVAGIRYRLLETVREFGRMQLVDAGDDADADAAMSAWATSVAAEAIEHFYSPDQIAEVDRVRAEEGNLVEVLRRALDGEDAGQVALLFGALSIFWSIEGSHLKIINVADQISEHLSTHAIPEQATDAARLSLVAAISHGMIFTGTAIPAASAQLEALGPGEGRPIVRANVTVVLALAGADRADQIRAIETLLDDADPEIAGVAGFWASQAFENAGDIERSRQAAERALSLVDPADGPWMPAMLTAHLAGIALQYGDWADARRYVEEAHPTLVAVGAAEDAAQLRSVLALVALREGDLDDADRILDELAAEEGSTSVFGAGIAVLCGRAEVLLARGDVDGGMSAYDRAVRVLGAPTTLSSLVDQDGFEPWVIFPRAAALAARVRHGRFDGSAAERDELLAKVRHLVADDDPFMDRPILGSSIAALGAWEAAAGNTAVGACLIAYAEAFSLNRMLPSLDPAWGVPMVDPAALTEARAAVGGRNADELRDAVITALAELA
ncbi:ATP-binding protein [Nocardioides sp. Kera G14]|uniref:ATP-binding protein n=1 Tax=Nocardioides sp. Kera G14 TaxID=2884264 RepID=UPI001D125B4A|nr:BTAD domain-containing putative transcriptional regulator [Nocardioides sp. Kera G14]UDY25289.1 hypothetical protein LH076_08400 [Nocardioides sp. Kera G14]